MSFTWDPSAALPLNCSVTFTSLHSRIIEIRYKATLMDRVSLFYCQFHSILLCCNAYAFYFVKFEMSSMLFFLWSLVEVHVGKITANVNFKSSVTGMVLSSVVLFVLETTSRRCSCCMKHTLFFLLSKVTLHAAFTSLDDPGYRKLVARL